MSIGKGKGTYNNNNPINEGNLFEVGGAGGSDTPSAKVVSLNASTYVITYDSTGTKSPSTQEIILTASFFHPVKDKDGVWFVFEEEMKTLVINQAFRNVSKAEYIAP
jgi:hypothetical protein